MPNTEIKIPNLTPGKRYRMVVSTNTETNGVANTTSAPSLEFVVPTSPRLLSTYTPTYSIISEPWSTTTYVTQSVAGTVVTAGSIRAASSSSKNITGWTRGNNIYPPYQFKVNNSTDLTVGQQFTVYGMSSPSGGDYYDRLIYTVVAVGTNYVGATAKIPSPTPSGFTTSWKSAGGAPLVTNTTTGNTGVLNYSLSAIPATDQTVAANPATITTPSVTSGTHYHVDVSVPAELQATLVNKATMFDLPIFFYIKNGVYYYLDDTQMTTSVLSLSSKPSTIKLTARNLNIGADYNISTGISSSRDYRFTVARYTQQGSSWTGKWLQKDVTYDTIGSALNRIVYSQSAVKA